MRRSSFFGAVHNLTKEQFNLITFFEGYVRNYRKLNFYRTHNGSMYTRREIEYFASMGEILGYHVFVEDCKPSKLEKSRLMDLSWWKFDAKKDPDNFTGLQSREGKAPQVSKSPNVTGRDESFEPRSV